MCIVKLSNHVGTYLPYKLVSHPSLPYAITFFFYLYCNDKMRLSLSLSIFIFIAIFIPHVTAATCHKDDESGLLGFKSGITSDPSNMLSSWKPGTDCCTWLGVDCNTDNTKRVFRLYLSGQPGNSTSFLSGVISPSLSKLKFLDALYLIDLKSISGNFPSFIFNLPNFQFLYLDNNKLSGPIPDNFRNLTRLDVLSLTGNRFTGRIPSSITELTQLTQLKLGGNLLQGTIPDGIRRLRNLTYLSLEQNQLGGTIPDFFSSFTDLRTLSLSRNKFSGKIPASISTLASKLTYLELGHNSLDGQIPDFLGKFKSLDTLDLSSNRFSGTVPRSFGNLTKIFNLDLSNNLLVDPFPEMNVKGIESLDLSNNRFHLKEIPKWVTSSPIIYSLKLAKCGIKMKMEDWKPSETYFYDYIDLSGNEITGSPVVLLNRTEYLVGFWASGNQLKFDLEKLKIPKTLKYLDLAHNSVFGKVSTAIAGLEKLNVSYNHLCGQIPTTKLPASAFIGNDCLCGSPLQPCKGKN